MAHDGLDGLERWQIESPDLVILDLNLPGMDGMALCRRIGAHGGTPIVILSVRSDDDEVVMGLQLGADDYVVKPFSPRQLIARIEAVLRRSTSQVITSGPIRAGDFTLDAACRKLWRDGQPVASLTLLETRLLELLIHNCGQVIRMDSLIEYVWGPSGGDRVMLKQLVYRLRHKIDGESSTSCLETVAGVGYAFAPQRPESEAEGALSLVG
jgi:DNA-binding response OmpR family regulator